jgi:carbon-monoxide dehydrogenase large subunit
MYRGAAEQDVLDVLAEVKRDYKIDAKRVYLMGHSMGAYGAWSIAMNHPGLFAALGPISGGGNPAGLEKIKAIPQYIVHGDNDKTVPVAQSRAIAEDALALIDVEFAPLPVVHDCRQALEATAPVVRSDAVSNIAEQLQVGFGEVDAAFAGAAHVFTESMFVHRGAAHPMEGRGVLARHDPVEDAITVWTSTQMAHEVMHSIAAMLGMDQHNVRVIAPDVGGGFGCKYLTYPEEVAIPAAARCLGRPVKWVEDRAEHFVSAIQERDQYWDVDIAVDASGLILGMRGRLLHDQGA